MFSRFHRLPLHNVARTSYRKSYRPLAGIAVVSGGLLMAAGVLHADYLEDNVSRQPLRHLIRSYAVFTMCSIPPLVDHSTKILSVLTSLPGIRQITEVVVRATFFNHFVGGDTAEGTLPLLREFRRANKGALLAYSVEVDPASTTPSSGGSQVSKEEPPHKLIIKELIHSIDVAAEFEDSLNDDGRRTWVAIKLTALVPDAQALINFSNHVVQTRTPISESAPVPFPGYPRSTDFDVVLRSGTAPPTVLTRENILHLRELYEDLYRVCDHARQRGVKIIIDAEWSWYQPAIDAVALALMREFNALSSSKYTVQPLVYTTYQAYLRRTPSHLALSLEDARQNNYALGVKLVRGAYHPYEISAHRLKGTSMSISPDELPPVWSQKAETDRCYNKCVKMLLNAVREDVSNIRSSKNSVATTPVDNIDPISKDGGSSWAVWLKKYISSNPVNSIIASTGSTESSIKLPSVGILFGTHNWESAKIILKELVENGLAQPLPEEKRPEDGETVVRIRPEVVERVAIGQLFGMSDDLTQYLVIRTRAPTPFIIKYVPYGALQEVMPYLSRRAIENKSVLGDGKATQERQRAGREIWKRMTGQS